MSRVIAIIYVLVFVMVAVWQDAMDSRYGVNGNLPTGWLGTTFTAALWPISVPLALGLMLTEDGGRWKIAKRAPA